MAGYKTELGNLDIDSRFYFPNDHQKLIWVVTGEKRKAAHGTAVFIFCENEHGNIEDFNSNRDVISLRPGHVPSFDEEKLEKAETSKPMVLIKPKAIPKINFHQSITPKHNNDMEHKESSIKIYSTNDYSCFRMINGNRQLNERKINKIIIEIKEGNDMLQYYPIQVKETFDERLDILDGQHRFYICKKLKRPVYYILIQEEKSLPEIAKINSNVEKWKASDFINCYVQHGNENYKILQNFLNEYSISLTVALQMLNLGNPGVDSGAHANLNESFRNGNFEIKKMEEAEALANDCRSFAPFPHCNSRSFVIAIYRVKKAGLIPLPDLLDAYRKRPEMLTQQATFKAYINTLEQIVNVGKKLRIVIVR